MIGEKSLSVCTLGANVSDKDHWCSKVLAKRLYGKLFADKGYISQRLLISFLRMEYNGDRTEDQHEDKLMPFYDRE